MAFTVIEILQKTKEAIEANQEIGGYIQIKGEVGTFKVYGKHAYLNLKEEDAMLKCVYFMVPKEIVSTVQEGSIVEAYGYLSIYEPRGEFQFYVKSMREISKTGLLMMEYERIKQALISENIIPRPPEEKRAIPDYPLTIGVITSRNGAALYDVIKTIEKRYPECTINLFHTGVQGKVENQIVNSLSKANQSKADLLLLVRGGGSFEDLWCFNHLTVVKAVRSCKKPIIVGVGHETDHTLCEYAADLIGSTPTAAAMLATPDMYNLIKSKKQALEKITILIQRKKTEIESTLNYRMKLIHQKEPAKIISNGLKEINGTIERISSAIQNKIAEKKQRMALIKGVLQTPSAALKYRKLETKLIVSLEKIKSNNPKRYFDKGLVRIEKNGISVNSVVELNTADLVTLFLIDGKADAKILELRKDQ